MKQKKNLMILLLIAIIGIIGVTIAYFSSRATFENVFETPEYGTEYIEKFTSPTDWKPGDVTEKTLEVKNSGNVDEAVRVKVEESWISQNGTTLPLKQGDNVAADIHWINEDDWIKVTVDGEDYYYYYYNYKLAPEETTSKLLDKVTFNPLINATTSCSDTVVDGVLKRTCNSSGAGYDGATYTLKFTIETVQYNKYKEAWGTNVVIAEEKPQPAPTGVEYLATEATNPANAEYNESTKGKMFQFTHTLNAGTENETTVNESRYIGDAPNNYVYFNCTDDTDTDTCEVWRIIGVFDVERTDPNDNTQTITERRMKLVRGSDFATTMAFNSSYNNDWTVAPLNTYLNNDYYNGTVDKGLTESAREKIEVAKYYLGAVSYNSGYGTTEKIYGEERGTTICGACNGNSDKLTWEGNVALMYPSDMYMVYKGVYDTCYINPSGCNSSAGKNGWVYNTNTLNGGSSTYTWLLSSRAVNSDSVLDGDSDAGLGHDRSTDSDGVRPVVYLKSNIQIIDGDGTSGNPYKLQ